MPTQRCAHCGQILPEFRLGVRLADHKARIFDLIRRSGVDGIAGDDLFTIAYDGSRVRWKRDDASRKALKAHVWGSTLVADGKVYCGDEDGDLFVFAASKQKKVISVTNLGGPVYSTPVVANGVLFVMTETPTRLYAIQDPNKKK